MQTYKTLSSVIRQVVTEAHTKDHPPFTPDEKSSFKKPDNKNRTDMDTVRALAHKARKAMQQKMKESFDLDITDEEADDLLEHILELDELSVATLSSYGKKAEKSANKNLDQSVKHQEKAFDQYNKGGSSADRSYDTQIRAIKHAGISDKRTAGANLAAKKLGQKFSKGDIKEGAPHQSEYPDGSEYMRTYSFSPEEHRQEGAAHLEDAKKHRDAGNMIKFRRSMIKHHESMITADLKDEKEKNNNRS